MKWIFSITWRDKEFVSVPYSTQGAAILALNLGCAVGQVEGDKPTATALMPYHAWLESASLADLAKYYAKRHKELRKDEEEMFKYAESCKEAEEFNEIVKEF